MSAPRLRRSVTVTNLSREDYYALSPMSPFSELSNIWVVLGTRKTAGMMPNTPSFHNFFNQTVTSLHVLEMFRNLCIRYLLKFLTRITQDLEA